MSFVDVVCEGCCGDLWATFSQSKSNCFLFCSYVIWIVPIPKNNAHCYSQCLKVNKKPFVENVKLYLKENFRVASIFIRIIIKFDEVITSRRSSHTKFTFIIWVYSHNSDRIYWLSACRGCWKWELLWSFLSVSVKTQAQNLFIEDKNEAETCSRQIGAITAEVEHTTSSSHQNKRQSNWWLDRLESEEIVFRRAGYATGEVRGGKRRTQLEEMLQI